MRYVILAICLIALFYLVKSSVMKAVTQRQARSVDQPADQRQTDRSEHVVPEEPPVRDARYRDL